MDWLDYRERLGIGFDDTKKYHLLTNSVMSTLRALEFPCSRKEYLNFCNMTGSYLDENHIIYGDDEERYSACLRILEKHTKEIRDFVSFYVAFANVHQLDVSSELKDIFVDLFKQAHISYEIVDDEDCWYLFPNGAQELDDALISQPLEWMKDYPLSHKAFIKALKEYSDVDEDHASGVADDFRKALETFLQEFFGEEKTIESFISIYGKYLKDNGVPKEIRGNFETLLSAYNNFNNAYAKHHDKTELKVLEYIMYQTGNIIRLLITLRNSEKQ